MNRTTIVVSVALVLIAALSSTLANAQNARSFVSPTGSDSNDCALATPCRTFQEAYNKTNPGGEIAVLATAGYGALTINKAISIVNPGAFEAGIFVPSGGTGITINAGASDAVSLRGLTIDGGGVGGTGIAFTSGKSLIIQNCFVRNLLSSGIAMSPSTSSNIVVSNTVVADNAGHGIFVQPSGGSVVYALFNHVEAYNNHGVGIGLYANFLDPGNDLIGKAIGSVAAYNGIAGFYAYGAVSAGITFHIYGSSAFANSNYNGVRAVNGGSIIVGQSDLMGDVWSVDDKSIVRSYGDNEVYQTRAPSGTVPRN